MKDKKYTLKVTKTGKEWKSFTKGIDFLEDDKKYTLIWELDSFWKYLRGWWGILRKEPHSYTRMES